MMEVLAVDPTKGLSIEEAEKLLQEARAVGIMGEVAMKIDGQPGVVALTTDENGCIQAITDRDSPRTQPGRLPGEWGVYPHLQKAEK